VFVRDPQLLNMWLTVNGESRQKGSTRTMVFGVAHFARQTDLMDLTRNAE
jgi:2-keto-4-pentenoate hydratase/2-oxohepta-3-ene-1,7-dioic acid hydratase in catechol pathway